VDFYNPLHTYDAALGVSKDAWSVGYTPRIHHVLGFPTRLRRWSRRTRNTSAHGDLQFSYSFSTRSNPARCAEPHLIDSPPVLCGLDG